MAPLVVDANVINGFQQERISGEQGPAQSSIEAIFGVSHIALDETGHCLQEWLDCASGALALNLQDWVNDMLIAQKIRLFCFCCDNMHRELSRLGVPKKDHKWVRLARGASACAIVTNDIDLFDPSMKGCSAKVAMRIKRNGSGLVARHIRRTYKIDVLSCESVTSYLDRLACVAA